MDLSLFGIGARALRIRWLVRAPIWLYRRGLGRLLGARFLMLEHTGRVSGEPRFVCLEVVDRPSPDRIVVVSGFGGRAQWYRNLEAEPECFVSTGRMRRRPAVARFLSEAEASAALERYVRAHPRDGELLRGAIEKAVGHLVQSLPMVELQVEA